MIKSFCLLYEFHIMGFILGGLILVSALSCSAESQYDNYLFMDEVYVKMESFVYDEIVIKNTHPSNSDYLFYAAFAKDRSSFIIEFSRSGECQISSCIDLVENELVPYFKEMNDKDKFEYYITTSERGTFIKTRDIFDKNKSACTESYFRSRGGIMIRIRMNYACSRLESRLKDTFRFIGEDVDGREFLTTSKIDDKSTTEFIESIFKSKGYKKVSVNSHIP